MFLINKNQLIHSYIPIAIHVYNSPKSVIHHIHHSDAPRDSFGGALPPQTSLEMHSIVTLKIILTPIARSATASTEHLLGDYCIVVGKYMGCS